MYRRDCVEDLYKNPSLNCQQLKHHPFFVQHLGILINLVLTIYAPPAGVISDQCSDLMWGCQSRLQTLRLIRRGMLGRHIMESGSL